MCGRYSLAIPDPVALRLRFGIDESLPIRPRFNIAPGSRVLALTGGTDGAPHGEEVWWGLLPPWAKTESEGFKMINARSETLATKRSFRGAFERRRCLICADGYYEWQPGERSRRQPFHITRRDGQPFAFAGLWSDWHPGRDDFRRTCTIITRDAVGELADIHPRMPVIVEPDAERDWLACGGDTDGERLDRIIAGVNPQLLHARPVSTAVNDASNDSPECLSDPTTVQPDRLFD